MQYPIDVFTHRAPRAHEPVRTFQSRRSPLGVDRVDALERLFPRWGFSVDDPSAPPPRTPDGLLDTVALFGRAAPLVVEIGSGMGDATAAMAAADPGRDWLAVEAHLPGLAALLLLVERHGLTNVRVAHGDALRLLRADVAPGSLDAVHAFFPDPWPKTKHHKRRLVQPEHVGLLRARLRVGGTLHVATDWADYAEQMRDVLTGDPDLAGGVVPRPAHRPVTRFEQRGLDLGHEVTDVIVRRVR
ncbi:tRNA (guanosine(46)-N7)-methyltransferase TrmB [Cellulomonas dongxiuzhuiae]|uniref:tRNA (guanosine(46)-N7)-methyltransferase TrmB n=1 Tax=Cellulomonas dongxiuzhuiae TaxID=2819979 RepID=UPI001AAFD4F0|nr:tRNA (guanosine(46)-N7)-methyltransferase TrmB [Cellulomonas dongxiuzhuiae]MBO3089872.1 tRNA (guanosine(46)-N7)-methyltransferase TrmB [Cellulomonas dongxiuzhuiae]